MDMGVALLIASFIVSLGELFVVISSMTRGLFGPAEEESEVIVSAAEENTSEDPAATSADQVEFAG